MKCIVVITLLLISVILTVINAWIKRSTDKMIDDFCREEHERYKKSKETEDI